MRVSSTFGRENSPSSSRLAVKPHRDYLTFMDIIGFDEFGCLPNARMMAALLDRLPLQSEFAEIGDADRHLKHSA